MRKGFTPAHGFYVRCSTLLLLTLITTSALAQAPGTNKFSDGAPKFSLIDRDPALTKNVVLTDTVVTLPASNVTLTEADTFRVVLSGIDWRYTGTTPIQSAEDIDRIPGDDPGLYLITDGIAHKIYLVLATTQALSGEFGGPLGTAEFLDRPVDAYPYFTNNRLKMVITDQGRHRVIQVDWLTGTIEQFYGSTPGNGPNQLSGPSDAVLLAGNEVLIGDTGNNRVVVADLARQDTVWSFGGLNRPVDVEPEAATGLFLVTDQGNHRVVLIQRNPRRIVWQFGKTGQATGNPDSTLNAPTDADVLPNGNILICDAGNKRLIEVDRQKKIVYTFAHPLVDLRDADRITENVADRNKQLVVANNRPVSQNVLPIRLAYKSASYKSAIRDFTRDVDFDSLRFFANMPVGTTVRLQLRSANTSEGVSAAKWYGPKDTLDFYTGLPTAVNRVHDGHRYYQFNADLLTTSPLLTPELKSDTRLNRRGVEVKAHYFDTNLTGTITSTVIRDSSKLVITSWQRFLVNSVLPADPQQRGQVQITAKVLDETGKTVLFSEQLSPATAANPFILSQVEPLRRKQRVRLQAELKTNNSSITPKLNDWQIEWQNTPSTKGKLSFTDENGRDTGFYRVFSTADNPPLNVIVYLMLDDMNLLLVEESIKLDIRAARSGDVQRDVQLSKQSSGFYVSVPAFPALMIPTNTPARPGVIEGRSPRDTLIARYVDPTDPNDVSIARVLMIQNVIGAMQVQTRRGVKLDTVSIKDSLFVHVTGELDRDISAARDSITIKFINAQNTDTEELRLYEVFNSAAQAYDTGEFKGRTAIPLIKAASIDGDGKLQVNGGDQVRVQFEDLDGSKLQVFVQVRPDLTTPQLFTLAQNKAFDFFVAPNPYHAQRNKDDGLRLGVVANTGTVSINKIEIYNLAGERIRTIDGANIPFRNGVLVGEALATDKGRLWWDMRTDTGSAVASGTYWAKFYVRFTEAATNRAQETTTLRKFVIVL